MLKNGLARRVMAGFGGVLMLAGVGTTGTAMAARFTATLNGDNVAGGGDRDGWGRLRARVDDTLNSLCIDLEVRSIDRVTSARIFRGRDGEEGEPVANLDRPGGDNDSEDCDNIGDTLADEIQSNPAAFYVLVTTAEFPNGALRGQLIPSTG
jgi:hypothetical protein